MLRKDKNDEDHYYQYDDSDFNDYGLDIHSEPNMSNAVLMFCHEDIMITYNCFDIDDVKEDYIDHVRKGEIKEKLPE